MDVFMESEEVECSAMKISFLLENELSNNLKQADYFGWNL